MSKKDEALKLALEALDKYGFAPCDKEEDWQGFKRAITAIREALAEQHEMTNIERHERNVKKFLADQPAQQEPVVWMYVNKSTHETKFQKHMRDFVDHGLWAEVPLYGEPLANQELNCVCGAVWQGDELVHLPRKPASKPWVGLTDEEVEQGLLRSDYALQTAHAWRAGVVFAMAKLKEKNT